jgi:sec-independent protein translocase protein TatB
MEKKWKEENERIMREHPPADTKALPSPEAETSDEDSEPVMVEKPVVRPSKPDGDAPAADKAAS